MQIEANILGIGYGQIAIQESRITRVQRLGPIESGKVYISPGFVDIQLNGFAGIDFSSQHLEPEEAVGVLRSLYRTGVATFCPTLVLNSHEQLLRNFRTLEKARQIDAGFAKSVPCYHLEGPYLSPGDSRGAHDPELMRPPDWREFCDLQEAAGGRIGIVTLAPELPGAFDFIGKARESGIIVAIGHTDASPDQIHMAVEGGAELSTHLGNGCPQLIHRHLSPLWAQLAIDQLSVSLICDGFHLPPEVVKVIVLAKGIEKCILITDAIHVATMPPGRYSMATTEVELLPTGQVMKVDSWCMAGSALLISA